MTDDLSELLAEWPHEPGKINVRKIMGEDGRERLQIRIDLGVMQMELDGRPDGCRPHGQESLLAYHRARARDDDAYRLSSADSLALQQETIQYYHRYMGLFELEDFERVVRDTRQNLETLDFFERHSSEDRTAGLTRHLRPFAVMMHTRAMVSLQLARGDYDGAVESILDAKRQVAGCDEGGVAEGLPPGFSPRQELSFLDELLREVRSSRPLSPAQRLEEQMRRAVEREDYEAAARLRDRLRTLRNRSVGDDD
jgi:hypothetical protein